MSKSNSNKENINSAKANIHSTKANINSSKANIQTTKENIPNTKQVNIPQQPSRTLQPDETNNYNWILLIPLIIILCIIPFIVSMKEYNTNLTKFLWFSDDMVTYQDFFLYYKQWTIISVASIMMVIAAIKAYFSRKTIRFIPIIIPLAVYAVLGLLSAIFSENSSISFSGGYEQFESIFVQLGYCLIVYYAFLFIQTERDIQLIINCFTVAILVMSVLGIFQYLGHDFFASEFGLKLILPKEWWEFIDEIRFEFEKNRVYLTLYNPNYVGVFTALVVPVFLILLLFNKKIIKVIFYVPAIIGLIICMIGSKSLAGLLGLCVAVVFILIFMWRYLLKRFYVVIPIVIILIISFFILNKQTDSFMLNRLKSVLDVDKLEYTLSEITTNDDNISLTYNGNKMIVSYVIDSNLTINYNAVDEKGIAIPYVYDDPTGSFLVTDERFPGFSFGGVDYNSLLGFYITIDGYQWYFTNQTPDGSYYLINRMGKLDKIVAAPAVGFKGYETFASGRGYLWSRTLPMLKDYVLLGSGSDTFVIEFPQQDYVFIQKYFPTGIITKPHSLYLQIAVQTGLLSLIAFLVFYGIYFISCVRLYIKGRFKSYYAQVGLSIFIGTVGYMVCGISNDSNTSTAPVFWVLIGIGIVANYKAKPFIKEEDLAAKEMKKNKLAMKAVSKSEIIDQEEQKNL